MSDRKLRGLLTTSPLPPKGLSHSHVSVKKISSPAPSPTIVPNSNIATPIIGAKVANNLVYYEIPGIQDFFYSPFMKKEINVLASPWLEPFKMKSVKELPPLSHASAHTAADSRGDQTANVVQQDNDVSVSLSSLAKKLSIPVETQPKNLEELLQRSFVTLPSQSLLQSPHLSAFPSPFIRSHSNALFQGFPGINSINDVSMKNNSMVKSPFVGPLKPLKPPVNPNTDEGLIFQIADLINRESDGKIRNAITELLAQYGDVEKLQKDALAARFARNGGDQAAIDNHKPKRLYTGLEMYPLNRSPKANPSKVVNDNFKSNPQTNKVEETRTKLIDMSEGVPKENKSSSQKQENNDFNLFNFLGETARLNAANYSPLISQGNFLNKGLNMNMLSDPFSHSLSQQVASMSTNSSQSGNNMMSLANFRHLEGPRNSANANASANATPGNKKSGFSLLGNPNANNLLRFNDNNLLNNKLLSNNFDIESWNNNAKEFEKINGLKNKLQINKTPQMKPATRRGKSNKITLEDYVRHVEAQSLNESKLKLDLSDEESDEWDDIDGEEGSGTPQIKQTA